MGKTLFLLVFFIGSYYSECTAQSKKTPPKKYNSASSNYNNDNDESGSKFCFNDSFGSGNKFQLRLIEGGEAKIIIKNSSDEIIRTGQGNWTGSSDGPGGNPPTIRLNLSTGVLRFTAIVDGYSSSINMLIDSRDNQWIKCW